MSTLFEHIVARRLSHEYENVATEALAFIVSEEPKARDALVDLLRAAQPSLSGSLMFSAQKLLADARPDLAGTTASGEILVLIENKFWAGLTEAQPVAYLQHIGPAGTLLAFVAPDLRVATLWDELTRRMKGAVDFEILAPPAGFERLATTSLGPRLALMTWGKLLRALDLAVAGSSARASDLAQLRGLCDRVDAEAFLPLRADEITDQRIPARILQLTNLAEKAIAVARAHGILSTGGLRPSHFFDRAGRYVWFGERPSIHGWLGVDLASWHRHGRTPVWVRFWGVVDKIGTLLQRWAVEHDRAVIVEREEVLVGVDLPVGQEEDAVVADIVAQVGDLKRVLPPIESPVAPEEGPTTA
ncbi:MAG: hypothetical protein AB1689_07850 [Thermodesulfobacteriota bacterium]